MSDEVIDQEAADAAGAALLSAKMGKIEKSASDDLLGKVMLRIKEDPEFADALKKEVQAARIIKFPPWLEPNNLFEATLNFGGTDSIVITTATFGNRIRTQLSTRMLRMQQALDKSERKIAPLMEANRSDEIDAGELDTRNSLIIDLGIAQIAESLGGAIVSGTGRFAPIGGIRKLMAKLDDASFKEACRLIEDLPQKVVDMISHAVRLMNNYGIEDKVDRGN